MLSLKEPGVLKWECAELNSFLSEGRIHKQTKLTIGVGLVQVGLKPPLLPLQLRLDLL